MYYLDDSGLPEFTVLEKTMNVFEEHADYIYWVLPIFKRLEALKKLDSTSEIIKGKRIEGAVTIFKTKNTDENAVYLVTAKHVIMSDDEEVYDFEICFRSKALNEGFFISSSV